MALGGDVIAVAGSGFDVFIGTPYTGVYHSPFNGTFWTHSSNGLPPGSWVTSICYSGNALLASTTGMLYRSTDNGQTWVPTAQNIGTNGFGALTVIDGVLFVGKYPSGIHRSFDDGLTWTSSSSGAPLTRAKCFTKMGTDIFVGTNNFGIYKSTNSGNSWSLASSSLTSATIWALANNGNYIFAGAIFDGAYISTDNGVTWTTFNNGLPVDDVYALQIKGTNLFAGTRFGVYKYDLNSGLSGSWTHLTLGPVWSKCSALYADATKIIAGCSDGVFISYDDGISWIESNNSLPLCTVDQLTRIGSHFLASTRSGLFDSQNGGLTWNSLNLGNNPGVSYSKVVQSGPNFVVGIGDNSSGQVKVSSDSGATWSTASGIFSGGLISAMATSGNYVVAGTYTSGIYYSSDNGLTWTPSTPGISGCSIRDISFAGSTGFAGALQQGPPIPCLYMSANNGLTWTSISLSGVQGVYCVETDGNTVLAGYSGGIYISTNAGLSWSQLNSWPATAIPFDIILNGSTVVVGSDEGVYVSNDLGNTWTQFNAGLLHNFVMSLYQEGNRIYAGTYGSSVYYYDGLLSSVNDLSGLKPGILVYPNPLSGERLHVRYEGDETIQDVYLELINAAGQLIQRSPLNISDNTFDLGKVHPGLYTVRVVSDDHTWHQKLVVASY